MLWSPTLRVICSLGVCELRVFRKLSKVLLPPSVRKRQNQRICTSIWFIDCGYALQNSAVPFITEQIRGNWIYKHKNCRNDVTLLNCTKYDNFGNLIAYLHTRHRQIKWNMIRLMIIVRPHPWWWRYTSSKPVDFCLFNLFTCSQFFHIQHRMAYNGEKIVFNIIY